MRHSSLRLLVLILFGFSLRLLLHDYHGLEGDDAFSLALSGTPAGELVRGLLRLELDIHPPLHFLVVKGWVLVAGESLVSLRLLNILLDTLTGALLIRVVRQVDAGESAPTVAGLLWAVSPLLIFGGWLVRMYTLLGFWVMAGVACVMEGARVRGSQRAAAWYGGAAVFAAAALWTHITGVIALGLIALGVLVAASKLRAKAIGMVGFALAVLSIMPFALNVWRLYTSGVPLGAEVNPANAVAPDEVVWDVLYTAFFHRVPGNLLVEVIFTVAVIAGVVQVYARASARGRVLPLVVMAGVAFVGMVALGAFAGLYKPRYLVPFVPLWLGVVALALASVLRWRLGGVVVMAVLGVMGFGQWLDLDRGWRDDWTAGAAWVDTYDLPGDAVVVVPDWGQEAMRYHYGGAAPVRGFFPQIVPGLDLDAAFGDYISGYERVWLVRYQPEVSDPEGLAAAWFAEQGRTVTQAYPAGMEITLFDLDPVQETLPEGVRPLDITFGGALALRGVALPDGLSTPALNPRLYDGSGRVLAGLYWEPLQANLTVMPRVRLTDLSGQVYGGALAMANDVMARYPVESWQPGEIVTVYADLNLNPTTPPGVYNIEVMVLDAGGVPLAASGLGAGETWMIAGQVEVR